MIYTLIIVVVILIFNAFVLLALFFRKGKNEEFTNLVQSMNDNIGKTNSYLNDFVFRTSNSIETQGERNLAFLENISSSQNKIIEDLTHKLSKIESTNREVLEFTSDLKKIEKILISQKSRGVFGEKVLETLLENFLPKDMYSFQYRFPNEYIVDAVIFLQNLAIPIDSKFPLTSYNKILEDETNSSMIEKYKKEFFRDIKHRIDECAKYISPEYGTTNFVFMFIPTEGVFNEVITLHNDKVSIMEYALQKNIIIVSPMSFFAYLQTIIQGLKMLNVEQNLSKIIKSLEHVNKDLNAFKEEFIKLGKSLNQAVKQYDKADNSTSKFETEIKKLRDM